METSALPPPAASDSGAPGEPEPRPRAPRPGQLTLGWRIVTGLTWGLVFVGFIAVWKSSRELGLSTWWLGPVGEPRPTVVMLLPFAAPSAMLLVTLNNSRWIAFAGLVAAAATAAIGVADLGRVLRLGLVEIAIAGAAAAVSVASFAGTYRRAE